MTTKTELLFMHFLVKHGVTKTFANNINGKLKNYLQVTKPKLLIAKAFDWNLVHYPGNTLASENFWSWCELEEKWIKKLNKQTS